MDPQTRKTESRKAYPTDLTDEQWKILEPMVPAVQPGPQPSKHSRREIVNAILYVLRSGCQWRMLPHDLPPWQLVYHYFAAWKKDGTWQRLNDTLRRRVRERVGRSPEPTAAIIDSQSAKTTEMGGPRGYDSGKKVMGRKRFVLVDVLGLLLAVLVLPANVQDRDGGWMLLSAAHLVYSSITKVWADGAFRGKLVQRAHNELNIDVEIVEKPADTHTFQVLPRRWVVERTYGWLNRERRLSKDYERLAGTTEAWVRVSAIRLMTRRLSRQNDAPPLLLLPAGLPVSPPLLLPAGTPISLPLLPASAPVSLALPPACAPVSLPLLPASTASTPSSLAFRLPAHASVSSPLLPPSGTPAGNLSTQVSIDHQAKDPSPRSRASSIVDTISVHSAIARMARCSSNAHESVPLSLLTATSLARRTTLWLTTRSVRHSACRTSPSGTIAQISVKHALKQASRKS